MTKRCKISETFNDEILLPEPMIQHIQSFLTGKEAARTTALSKSWYSAWLTRPTFDFDQLDFNMNSVDLRLSNIRFAEVTTKNMQRYQDSNMKIDNFRLGLKSSYTKSSVRESANLAIKLIVSALQRGAKELDLNFRSDAFVLPREVLESEQLVRLSLVNMRAVDGNVRCWRLKSLSLHRMRLGNDDIIRDILSCCLLIEELSISSCLSIPKGRPKMVDLSGMNMFKLHKLRRMCLKSVRFDRLFFSDFASRYPCMKDLSVSDCRYRWSEAIQIASTSLESMSFVKVRTLKAEFDVPNLVSFRYSGEGIPSLRIESESSREWESAVSITALTHSTSSYLRLKNLLTQLRSSKISLCMSRSVGDERRDIKVISKSDVVVECLTIDLAFGFDYNILSGLLSICRPKFIMIYWYPHLSWRPERNDLCKRVMEEIITPNCEISDRNMFGQLGLMQASVEVLDVDLEDPWLPLFLNEPLHALTTQKYERKLLFQLRWG